MQAAVHTTLFGLVYISSKVITVCNYHESLNFNCGTHRKTDATLQGWATFVLLYRTRLYLLDDRDARDVHDTST